MENTKKDSTNNLNNQSEKIEKEVLRNANDSPLSATSVQPNLKEPPIAPPMYGLEYEINQDSVKEEIIRIDKTYEPKIMKAPTKKVKKRVQFESAPAELPQIENRRNANLAVTNRLNELKSETEKLPNLNPKPIINSNNPAYDQPYDLPPLVLNSIQTKNKTTHTLNMTHAIKYTDYCNLISIKVSFL